MHIASSMLVRTTWELSGNCVVDPLASERWLLMLHCQLLVKSPWTESLWNRNNVQDGLETKQMPTVAWKCKMKHFYNIMVIIVGFQYRVSSKILPTSTKLSNYPRISRITWWVLSINSCNIGCFFTFLESWVMLWHQKLFYTDISWPKVFILRFR